MGWRDDISQNWMNYRPAWHAISPSSVYSQKRLCHSISRSRYGRLLRCWRCSRQAEHSRLWTPRIREAAKRRCSSKRRATLVLTSAQYSKMWESSERTVVAVSRTLIRGLSNATKSIHSAVEPRNIAYVIPTSGSTGVPKGGYDGTWSCRDRDCFGHGEAFRLARHTRALQFASCTFDVCITEIFTAFLFGGCVCVPSDDRRNNLTNFINTMDVNWALLTPTVARLLDPGRTNSLKVLVSGGEQLLNSDCQRWEGRYSSDKYLWRNGMRHMVYLLSRYAEFQDEDHWAAHYLCRLGSRSENHHKLAPLGSTGELLIEGPILARGYLNNQRRHRQHLSTIPPGC